MPKHSQTNSFIFQQLQLLQLRIRLDAFDLIVKSEKRHRRVDRLTALGSHTEHLKEQEHKQT